MAYTTIDKPSDFFETKLYVGNESTNAITGLDFQPDWVWLKNRDTSYYHGLYDSVRGTGNTKSLYSNAAEAEGQNSGNMNLASFNSDGFTLGATSSTNIINKSSQNHVSWNWKAGTSFSNDASSTSVGSLDSAGSVSTDAGFSIISYTGAGDGQASSTQTVAHGLGVVPQVLIVKNLADATNWFVYHHKNTSAPATDVLYLNLTNATGDDNGPWNDVAPTSSVFTVGGDNGTNGNGDGMIAYCFAEKQGYSKFGSYTGNNNANGTFVYTGFKPAYVMTKVTNTTDGWMTFDNKRNPHNVMDKYMTANGTGADSTRDSIDFVSNGFKLRVANTDCNNGNYIYIAFAENPFITSTGVPATAR